MNLTETKKRVLMTRGLKGYYVYYVNKDTEVYLRKYIYEDNEEF